MNTMTGRGHVRRMSISFSRLRFSLATKMTDCRGRGKEEEMCVKQRLGCEDG